MWLRLRASRRVEAGKNTSTVIPARSKRRRKGNPVVSDEMIMFGYESSATLTTYRLHYKLQTNYINSTQLRARHPCVPLKTGEKKKKKYIYIYIYIYSPWTETSPTPRSAMLSEHPLSHAFINHAVAQTLFITSFH
jgi:hypothetical protein